MVIVQRYGLISAVRGTSQATVDRPQDPNPDQVWTNPDTGVTEYWNGSEWARLTKLDHILPAFGLGTLGDVTVTGTTTLTADSSYENLTIASGGVLKPAGFRIFVKGRLLNNGNIDVSGNDGSNGLAGGETNRAGGAAGNGTGGFLGSSAAGGAGGGADIGVAGTVGSAGGNSTTSLDAAVAGAAGGSGGNGEQSGAGAGAGGTVTAESVNSGSIEDVTQVILFRSQPSGSSPTAWGGGGGGSGGGGGGGDATSGSGTDDTGGSGGGGGAAGHMAVIIASIVSGTGTLTGIGGDGGNGGNGSNESSTDSGGGGGGGAAQGSFAFLIFSTKEDYNWTVTLTGGVGGTGGAGGTGGTGAAGSDGSDGSAGVLYEYEF